MTEMLNGFPFWILEFDKDGQPADVGAVDRFVGDVKSQGITDVFIFSHGWNSDRATALSLYQRFFGEISKILNDGQVPKKNAATRVGFAGIVWPSILWPDDAASATMDVVSGSGGGGAASMSGGAVPAPSVEASPGAINIELKKAYDESRQQSLVDELTTLLEKQPKNEAALIEFRTKLTELIGSEPVDAPLDRKHPDYAEAAIGQLSDSRWRELLDRLGTEAARRQPSGGGGVGLGDPFKKLWAGAKDALRVTTYWQMKQRAGIIGRTGLGGVVLTRLARDASTTRIHLLGHSFGARLVSFSLSGLPQTAAGAASPVKSLFLLQGAFSHYAFAERLPHDASRSGALKGMTDRVDGPLLTTHSLKDLAVGLSYPVASFLNQDDAAAAIDQSIRWGAMGHDGAQAVDAATAVLVAPGTTYQFQKHKWLNLDGNRVIIHGAPPAGAHSDIVYPHTAWAALAAAAIV
jgi:hypothetical protein